VSLVALAGLATRAEAAAAVTLTPTSLTFAAQAIGTTSAPQSATVANTGDAPLFINSAAVPNTLDFTEVPTSTSVG
jgi:P pilus assembly chaperone PapD